MGVLECAARVVKEDGADGKCAECDSYMVTATYKAGDRTPFPGGLREHTGCLLCDTIMRGTLVNFFARRQPKKTVDEMTEEERKTYEEGKRKKDEKRKKREEDTKGGQDESKVGQAAVSQRKKKQKSGKGPNMLTAEEMMNDFIKKQFGAGSV